MSAYLIMGVRLVVMLTFLVGMPVLALPQVADWCAARLYAPPAKRRIVAARPAPVPLPPVVQATELGARTELPWATQAEYTDAAAEIPVAAVAPPEPDLGALAAEVQSLGATFYRLEQLQREPVLYRFTAEVQSAGAVPQRAQFSATAASAAGAVRQVIDQIAAGR